MKKAGRILLVIACIIGIAVGGVRLVMDKQVEKMYKQLDAVAVVAVYNVKETYMNGHMPIVLKADVNHDKVVNAADFGVIKAEYMK